MSRCFQKACKRAKGPAEALADQRVDGFRRFGPADGVFVVENVPAVAANGDGQVGVFRHGIALRIRPAAQRLRCARRSRAPGTTGMQFSRSKARFSRFWLVMYSSACQRVSQRLRLHDFHVAGDGADARIGEMAHKLAEWRRDRSTVSASMVTTISPRGFGEAVIQGRGLAVIGLVKHAHARIAAEVRVERVRRCGPCEPSLTTRISSFG